MPRWVLISRVSARVADDPELPLVQRTGHVQVTVTTSWAPLVINLALAVLPKDDDLLNIGSNIMRKRQGIDVMSSLREAILNRSSDDAYILSADKVTQAALERRETDAPTRVPQGMLNATAFFHSTTIWFSQETD